MTNVSSSNSERNLSPFYRLQGELANIIANTKPGEKLPSEPKLAEMLGVSRATLREAMRAFEGQGLIRRRQGVGTFVVGPANVIESGLEVLESIEVMAHKIGLDVTMGDLSVERILADEELAENLCVDNEQPVIKISRVILADGRPVAYLIDMLPEVVLAPEDLRAGFRGSVLDKLLASNNYSLTSSKTVIKAVAASSSIARALEIQRGDVLQLFIAHLYDDSGNCVDYSYSYFLPGYFKFHVVRNVGQGGALSMITSDQ